MFSKLAAIKVDYDKNISFVVPKFITLKVQFFRKLLIKKISTTPQMYITKFEMNSTVMK